MKVPIPELPKAQTRPVGASYDQSNYKSPLNDLAKGFQTLGAGVERMEAQVARATEKADAVSVAESLTAYQHEDNTLTPKYFALEGKTAVEQSESVLTDLETRRTKIRDSLTNDRQKALFDEKSRAYWETTRGKVEAHVAGQRKVAEKTAAKGLADETVAWLQANPNATDEETSVRLGQVQSLILALEEDPKAAQAASHAWYAEAQVKRLEALVAGAEKTGDWNGAKAVLAREEPHLDPKKAADFRRIIDEGGGGSTADTAALNAIRVAANEEGKVDRALAEKGLATLESNPTLYRKAAQALDFHLGRAEKAWDEKVTGYVNRIIQVLNADKSFKNVSATDYDWLQKNEPDQLRRLEKWALEEDNLRKQATDRFKKEEKDAREEARARRRELRERAAETERTRDNAKWEILNELTLNAPAFREMTTEQFAARYRTEVTEQGFATLLDAFEDNKKANQVSESKFNDYVKDELANRRELRSKADKEAYSARMGEAWRAWRKANDYRLPTDDELKAISTSVWEKKTTGVWIWRKEKEVLKGEGTIQGARTTPARGTQTRPSAPAQQARPTKAQRARQLKSSGLTNADIARRLDEEGY